MIFPPPMPYTYDDGCKVDYVLEQGIKVARVVNPDGCQDRQFVIYLNCQDNVIIPNQYRKKECQQ